MTTHDRARSVGDTEYWAAVADLESEAASAPTVDAEKPAADAAEKNEKEVPHAVAH